MGREGSREGGVEGEREVEDGATGHALISACPLVSASRAVQVLSFDGMVRVMCGESQVPMCVIVSGTDRVNACSYVYLLGALQDPSYDTLAAVLAHNAAFEVHRASAAYYSAAAKSFSCRL